MFFQRPPEWQLWEVFFLSSSEFVDKKAQLGFGGAFRDNKRLVASLYKLHLRGMTDVVVDECAKFRMAAAM